MIIQIGEVYATKGVNEDAEKNENFREFINICINRHINKDCGEMEKEDIESNKEAIINGSRIFSSYLIGKNLKIKNDKFWIITEADRSSTTVLLPSEY